MKKKLFNMLLMVCMIACMLVGCGEKSDSDSDRSEKKTQSLVDLNDEKQISAKDFARAMEAFKEYYDVFYEEHRFNGTYEQPEDCIANVYMIGDTPIMVILDMMAPSEYYFTADLYVYEYADKGVQERAKYPSIKFGDDEIFLYPLQDKLFMGYYDEERNYKVAELDEYFTKSKEEVYIVAEKDYEDAFEEDIEENITICCDDFDEFVKDGIWEVFEVESHYNTGLAKENDGGYYLLREDGIEALSLYSFCNYALVLDRRLESENDDYLGCLYSTSFKKYLDYLVEQEITNNVQLLISHADYLESIGVSDGIHSQDSWIATDEGKKIDTIVWFNGIYYYIVGEIAYPIAYDFGYSKDDLPKKVYGYKVKDGIVDILLAYYPSDRDITAYREDLEEEFPISVSKRVLAKDIWKEVEVAKAEYEQTVGVALEAYEDYIEEKDYDGRDYYYSFIYIDDNDTPELYVKNEWGFTALLAYYDGQVIEHEFSAYSLYYHEREGIYYDAYNRWAEYGWNAVYKLEDGKKIPMCTIHYSNDFSTGEEINTNYLTVSPSDGYSEENIVSDEEANAAQAEVLKDCKTEEKEAITYRDFDEACEEAGLIH